MQMTSFCILCFTLGFMFFTTPASKNETAVGGNTIITGADQTNLYLPYLKGKRIGMLVNQT